MSSPTKVRGDIDFIVDPICVTLLVPKISLELVAGISPNLHGYIVGTSLRADQILVTLTSIFKSQEVKEC